MIKMIQILDDSVGASIGLYRVFATDMTDIFLYLAPIDENQLKENEFLRVNVIMLAVMKKKGMVKTFK